MAEKEKPWSLKNKIVIKNVNEEVKKDWAKMAASINVDLSSFIKTMMSREFILWKNSKK